MRVVVAKSRTLNQTDQSFEKIKEIKVVAGLRLAPKQTPHAQTYGCCHLVLMMSFLAGIGAIVANKNN